MQQESELNPDSSVSFIQLVQRSKEGNISPSDQDQTTAAKQTYTTVFQSLQAALCPAQRPLVPGQTPDPHRDPHRDSDRDSDAVRFILTCCPFAWFGTMLEDCWGRSMWRATWILFLSLLTHSTQAQGKKNTGSVRFGSARLGSARLGADRSPHRLRLFDAGLAGWVHYSIAFCT